jgi:hypothetical protein
MKAVAECRLRLTSAMMSTLRNAESWAKFEQLLAAMCPGDVITAEEAVYETGMLSESVQLVLEVLARADLFEQHGEHFMRIRSLSVPASSGPHVFGDR